MSAPKLLPATRADLLTVEQAAARLGISPGTLRHWVTERRIDFVRVGRKLTRFRPADVEAFIDRHVEKAVPR